jgi:hypothetical protein
MGKLTGADKNKIQLHSDAAAGLNGSGINYKIFGMKVRK